MTTREAAFHVIAAINAHDVDAVVGLCNGDRFVDARGHGRLHFT